MQKTTTKQNTRIKYIALSALAISSLISCARSTNDIEKTTVTPHNTAAANIGPYGLIPGPRDCFWARGPHSADPYINVAYPDANVFYWAAVFSMPEGSKLDIQGEYAHARYQSFISYDERGRPVESLADYLIAPNAKKIKSTEHAFKRRRYASSDGDKVFRQYAQIETANTNKAANPFITGNRRDLKIRDYSFAVINQPPTHERRIGEISSESDVNLLHTPAYGTGQQLIIYRIYLPDDGTAPAGGVPLPKPILTLKDGTRLEGKASCAHLKSRQPLQVGLNAVGITPDLYRTLITQPGKPDTHPAQNPAKWFIQLDRKSLLGIYTGEMSKNPRRSEGGFYPNLDNQYIRTIVNRKHGKVFMVRGKMPTTPHTVDGDPVMGGGELRYWSICSNQGFVNTRVTDCLYDEEIPLDKAGFYTVMVSRVADRPRNARPECGLAWLPMADDGDGMFDEDVSIVQIRNMLANPDFKHAVQRVDQQKNLASIMGPYLPQTRYLMPNQVESFFPCGGLD